MFFGLDNLETPVTMNPPTGNFKNFNSSKVPPKYLTFTFGEIAFTLGEITFTFGYS